jgi:hypothetical protein
MPVAEVSRLVSDTTEFKTNCNMVSTKERGWGGKGGPGRDVGKQGARVSKREEVLFSPVDHICGVQVILDFFIRHGLISPDTPGYLELVGSMRSGACS